MTRHPPPNLPVELTTTIGRRGDIAEISRLLKEHRSLSVSGPVGVGKSHLAVRVAWLLSPSFGSQTWYVDLRDVSGDRFDTTMASAFDLEDDQTMSVERRIAERLAEKKVLFVIDNADRCISEVETFVRGMLTISRSVTTLVTSRGRSSVPGQAGFTLEPMALPPISGAGHLGALGSHSVVELFVDRAKRVRSTFALTADNAQDVVTICTRLDGLPLAIERAAVHMRAMTPYELLRLLTDSAEEPGQASPIAQDIELASAVGETFMETDAQEREFWSSVSVFTGPFTLESAEAVHRARRPGAGIVGPLTHLIDRSVILVSERGSKSYYRVIQEYRHPALQQLASSGQEEMTRRAHAEYVSRLVTETMETWFTPGLRGVLETLELQHDDISQALRFLTRTGAGADVDTALALAVGLTRYWMASGRIHEGRVWISAALDASSASGFTRRTALVWNAWLAISEGETTAARALLQEAEAIPTDSASDVGHYYMVLGATQMHTGRLDAAAITLREAASAYGRANDDRGVGETLSVLFMVEALRGGSEPPMLGPSAPDSAKPWDTRIWSGPYEQWINSLRLWRNGDLAGAIVNIRNALQGAYRFGDRYGIACQIATLACILTERGDLKDAARLHGFVRSFVPGLVSFLDEDTKQSIATLRAGLGDAGFDAQFAEGADLDVVDVIEIAVGERIERASVKDDSAAKTTLTRRESEVARLTAHGLSNQEIATELTISRRTAEGHVQNILMKLGFVSRAQIAYWFALNEQLFAPSLNK